MKAKAGWRRLSGSTRRKIESMIGQGWQPDRALSPYESERRHRQDECDTPPVTDVDLALVDGERP